MIRLLEPILGGSEQSASSDHPKSPTDNHGDISTDLAMISLFVMLVLYVITNSIISKHHLGFMHPSAPLIFIAMGLSFVIYRYAPSDKKNVMSSVVSLDFIYKLLLPPIVLAEGFNLRKRTIGKFSKEITAVGIVIPVMTLVLLTMTIYGASTVSESLPGFLKELKLDMLFSECAMIAVTLGTIDLHGSVQPLHGGIHNDRLSTIIFGSGMFNNNMSLIFVMTLERLIHDSSLLQGDAYVENFMKVGLLSTLFGFLIGGLMTFLMKKSKFLNSNALYEVFFVILGAYTCYMLAHLSFFQLSGDVAIFFYGFTVGHYNKYNISMDAIKQLGLLLNIVYVAAEAFCFIYLGLSFESSLGRGNKNLKIAGIIVLIMLGCRFFCMMVVAFLKRKDSTFRIFGTEWLAVCFSGMIKGPLAYIFGGVVVSTISSDLESLLNITDDNPQYKKIQPLYIVQLVVLISIFILAPINYFVFKATVTPSHDHTEKKKKTLTNKQWNFEEESPKVWTYVDKFFLKPLLIRDFKNRTKGIVILKKQFEETAGLYEHGHNDHDEEHVDMGHKTHETQLYKDHDTNPSTEEIHIHNEEEEKEVDIIL